MKKIKLYIACSLDGYIARADGDLSWLTEFPLPVAGNYDYQEFLSTVDTIIMGGKAYRNLLTMIEEWPHKDQLTYVVSHHTAQTNEKIKFIAENAIETIASLRQGEGNDIWLVGGGVIISMLLNAGLVDHIQMFYIPVILGDGTPLFPGKIIESKWKLRESKSYDNGVVEVIYSPE